jgi:branched-chain amino acid transport system substrate-binding protein
MTIVTRTALLSVFFLLLSAEALSNDKKIDIYLDADYANHESSASAIMMGFNTALDEVGHQIQGYTVEIVPKNHSGNSIRSKQHMKEYLADPKAIVFLGGLHSSPYIKYRDYINENGILLLVPWAAGGPITRYDKGLNWVFRLSIDDTKAGYRIAQYAYEKKSCKNPHLLLEETPWGKSNFNTMSLAYEQYSGKKPEVSWFEWNLRFNLARIILRDIGSSGADCILFVGNSLEGQEVVKAMASIDEEFRLPIISHWGITGGQFEKDVTRDVREKIDLSFIQTCFSFVNAGKSGVGKKVFDRVKKLYPDKIVDVRNISSPPGLIHGYDLGKIFLQAISQVKLTGNMQADRASVREELERLKHPVVGLIKTYSQPFRPWSIGHPDAHEALGINDFCMAAYDADDSVIVFPN